MQSLVEPASSIAEQPAADLRLVRVDKIASSTVNLRLSHELETTTRCEARAGNVVVVRTLTDNATYNTLELVTGRMAKINPGDIIAGVLGYRRALKGFVGDVPASVKTGDQLHLLNLGGLVGRCVGHHHSLSGAIEVEVLGMAVRDGQILNIAEGAVAPRETLDVKMPLVLVAGTCMNSGKTYAATEIIKHLTRAGHRVAGAKVAGVACLRDTLNMQDHGAVKTMSFLDCGLPSTVGLSDLAPIAKGVISKLAQSQPDCIVIELGDGLLGGYGVNTGRLNDAPVLLWDATVSVAHPPLRGGTLAVRAYPVPLREGTDLAFELPRATHVSLVLYDIAGRPVKPLINEWRDAGPQQVRWDGKTAEGSTAAAGVYFYRLGTETGLATGRLIKLE